VLGWFYISEMVFGMDGRENSVSYFSWMLSLFFHPFFLTVHTDGFGETQLLSSGWESTDGEFDHFFKKNKRISKNAYRMGTDLRGGFFWFGRLFSSAMFFHSLL